MMHNVKREGAENQAPRKGWGAQQDSASSAWGEGDWEPRGTQGILASAAGGMRTLAMSPVTQMGDQGKEVWGQFDPQTLPDPAQGKLHAASLFA